MIKEGYKETSIGLTPIEWKVKKLNEITKVYDGTHQTPNYVEEGIPFYSVEHVTSNNFNTKKFITKDVFDKENKRVKIEQEDILMTRIGDVGTVKYIDWDVNASFYVSLALMKKSANFNSRYISHFFRGSQFQKELWKRIIHTAFPKKINLGELSNCSVALPPLPEQQKIATILSTVDAKLENITQQIYTTEQLKKGLMQQLLSGRFNVLENRPYTKEELKDSPLGKIPKDWEVVKQAEVAIFFNGRAYKLKEWEEKGTPVIRLQNLTGSGKDYYYSNLKLPEHQYCYNGDLLYMWSATMGPVWWNGKKAIYHYDIWKIEHSKKLNKVYHYYLLDNITRKLKSQSHGSTMLHITKGGMEKLNIQVPPFNQQQKIADILSSIDNKIEQLHTKKEHYNHLKTGLMQQLLTGKIRVTL